jgi:hypothetical protein
MRKLACAFGVVAMVVGAASTALAAPPATEEVNVTFPSGLCTGVNVLQTLQGTQRTITANPHKDIQVFPGFRVSFTANGKTLSTAGPAVLHITYNPDGSIAQTVVTGLLGALTVPGHGVILLDAGYIVFAGAFAASPVIDSKGPHEFFGSQADFEAFCAYFEGTL